MVAQMDKNTANSIAELGHRIAAVLSGECPCPIAMARGRLGDVSESLDYRPDELAR